MTRRHAFVHPDDAKTHTGVCCANCTNGTGRLDGAQRIVIYAEHDLDAPCTDACLAPEDRRAFLAANPEARVE